jgi:hypothetical protein
VRGGDYLAAVRAIDRAELTRCIDEADPLTATLDQLTATGARASVRALATIGHFVHRELDPTQPVSDAERAARQRWRAAYHAAADRRWRQHGLHMVLFAAGIGASIAVGNALPVVLIGLALAGWARARPLPGLDLRTSQLVRAIADPLQILKSRRYRVIDVFTFIFTLVIAGGLAARLPPRPTWLDSVEVVAVFVIAIAATRGRRRWVRHERQRLQPLSLDPNTCCCLDAAALHGAHARDYVTNHLFQVGTAPGAPKWQVLQCLDTHARFLDIPAAKLALRLPLMPPRSGAPVEEP